MTKRISTANLISNQRLPGLDTLRALAIAVVMVFHLHGVLPDIVGPIARFGWMGVDLFFVLSGYLIGSQLFKPVRDGRGISLLGFYRKRAYRILPVYLVVLALYVFWPLWREAPGISPLWQFLTFTENFFVDYSVNQAFSHVWSLCVEEHFYLLLPMIVLLMSRKAATWKTIALLALLVALGLAIRSYVYFHVLLPLGRDSDEFSVRYIERMYYPTYTRLDGLLAGVALALMRIFRPGWWSTLSQRANWLLAGGVMLMGCTLWMFADRASAVGNVIGFPLMAIAMAMLVMAAADRRSWFGRVRVPGARLVATLAYSLYLTHKEIAHLDELWLPKVMDARDWKTVCVLVLSCVAAAGLMYVAIERPFLALRDRREGRPIADLDQEARVEPAL
ncbi:MAG: acyltransferase [Acidobacteriaceae bacterium]